MNEKTPFIRIAKREDLPKSRIWMIRTIAFAVAILLGALIFLIAGTNPFTAYGTIIASSLGKITGIRQVIKIAVPLLGTALALAPCFAMRFWNIGGEGQITMGAVAASFFALNFAKTIPSPILLLLMGIFAMVFGAMWAAIPAAFKARWGTNETLFTLMMNYIAIQLVSFAIMVWVPNGSSVMGVVNSSTEAGWLPMLFDKKYFLNVLVVAILTAVMYVYLKYSKHGYEISVVGESKNTAKYIGINVKKVIIRTMVLSGAICGLAGFLLVSGTNHSISTGLASGNGFTAIMVSWLAKFNPAIMVVTSFLIVFLQRGASEIATNFNLNESVADILTGVIIFFIIGCEFFINHQIKPHRKHKEDK